MLRSKLSCSFCRRSATEVAKLVAGPRVYICDRCANEVIRIMNEPASLHSTPLQRLPIASISEWLRRWWRYGPVAEA